MTSMLLGKIRPLPSTQTFRAFEAAVRFQSFTRASEELHLSAAAVSRHVQTLEDRLGVCLFERAWGRMIPTATAVELAHKVRRGLIELQEAVSVAISPAAPRQPELQVNVCADFALHWLIPNIHRFNAIYPDIKLTIDTRAYDEPIENTNFDACIWGGGLWKGECCSRELSSDTLIVCANKTLSRELPPITASTLSTLPFLRISCRDWHDWLEAAELPIIESSFGHLLDSNGALIQAAIAGLGIALIRKKFAQLYLDRGDLQQIHEIEVDASIPYFVIWSRENEKHLEISNFAKWVCKYH